MISDLPIALRAARHDEFQGIKETWLAEFRRTLPVSYMPQSIYNQSQCNVIDDLLPLTTVVHLDESPDAAIAWICSSPKNDRLILHWAHTNNAFRDQGIFRSLIKDYALIVCTHFFKLYPSLHKKYNMIYDPTFLKG